MLFLKSLIFGLALFTVVEGDVRVIPILFFGMVAALLYSRPLFSQYNTRYAFLILLVAAILGMEIVAGSIFLFPTLLLFSSIFYILLGIKDYLFIKRSRLYFISILLIFYIIFIIFFLANKSELFFLKYFSVILSTFFLIREWLSIIASFHFPSKETIAALVSAFLVGQLLWVVALLPIGFISASNFTLLFVFTLVNLLFHYFSGKISGKLVAQHLLFFLILSAVIFGTSSWSLSF